MSIFSMGWFRSKKQKETEEALLEVAKMQLEVLKRQSVLLEAPEKPYKSLKLINDQLTIVLHSGKVLTKPAATADDFRKAKDAKYEEELELIASHEAGLKEQEEQQEAILKAKLLIQGIEVLKTNPEFEVVDNTVYLKDKNGIVIKRSLPQLLVEQFITLAGKEESEEYQALKKFWLKCCLNPNAQSAEDLYKFLNKHQFKIDRHGNFYAYRRVVSSDGGNKALVDFVSNTYNKIKGVWKKKPVDYNVIYHEKEGYSFVKIGDIREGGRTLVGNLQELYLNLPNMQEKMFTSAHTGEEDYKVGEVISMPRDIGDDNNQISCSKGFHAASKAYDYSGFGDTPILVIINPMDVLAVPQNEDGKLRTCRWFFAMTLTREEQHILDDKDFDTMDLGDVFEEKCAIDLQGYVQNSFAEEVKRHTFTIPQISARDINNIIRSLDEMRESLDKRVVQFE